MSNDFCCCSNKNRKIYKSIEEKLNKQSLELLERSKVIEDLKNSLRAKKKSLNKSTSLQNLREKEFGKTNTKY